MFIGGKIIKNMLSVFNIKNIIFGFKLNKKRKFGFTLMELIVVIAILGILSVVLVPKFMTFTKDAKQAAIASSARSIIDAVEINNAQNPTAGVDMSVATVTSIKDNDNIKKYIDTSSIPIELDSDIKIEELRIVSDVSKFQADEKIPIKAKWNFNGTGGKVSVGK